jgi:hypothetical protein
MPDLQSAMECATTIDAKFHLLFILEQGNKDGKYATQINTIKNSLGEDNFAAYQAWIGKDPIVNLSTQQNTKIIANPNAVTIENRVKSNVRLFFQCVEGFISWVFNQEKGVKKEYYTENLNQKVSEWFGEWLYKASGGMTMNTQGQIEKDGKIVTEQEFNAKFMDPKDGFAAYVRDKKGYGFSVVQKNLSGVHNVSTADSKSTFNTVVPQAAKRTEKTAGYNME